jgi:hypothetical protein
MAAIDTLIKSLKLDIERTAEATEHVRLGQEQQTRKLNMYRAMLSRALFHKRYEIT